MRAVRVSSTSHRVEIVAETRDDVRVTGDARVDESAGSVTVDRVRGALRVAVPAGTDVVVGTTTGRVTVRGAAGAVCVVTDSGRISVEQAGSVDARTSSARVEVGAVAGACRIRTQSGRVLVEACGAADVATTSGRIELPNVAGTVRSHCVSGRIEIGLTGAHDVDAETVSGRVAVSVPSGVSVHRPDAAGGPSADDADCTVAARSVSGRVDVETR